MVTPWRTVRVFISSTFRDMHAERDHLVKVVFPELRERCAKRQLHLVDMDLRWGVTEDEAEQGKVLHIILDEIDRSRPFFVAILGERYGSVPDKVPEDTEFSHPWLRDYSDHSLTALEIIHGVLRDPDLAGRSIFYFRDSQFISQVPEIKRADFIAENPAAARKLATLKDKIRASGRPIMENYPCRWDDVEGRLVALDKFGQQVLDNLWTAICKEYPKEAPEADPLAIERQIHESFAEERSHLHVGRVEQAKQLTEYVQGTDRRPVVITGESGCGKSAFLASWYRRHSAENPDDFVLAYFIGASPDSTSHFRLLRNMCLELKRQFALKQEIPEGDKKLPETLALMLATASQYDGGRTSLGGRLLHKSQRHTKNRRIVIVLDALDQLLPLEAAHGLGWLLDYMPKKARLVVSTLEGDCLDVLRRREAEEIALPPLTENEQRQIVKVLLSEWRRKLDEKQTAALLTHPGVRNPLYLRVALEELRLFGKFEQLTERIKALAADIPGLFDQVLKRLEEDHGQELVSQAFSLLGCSRYGLSEFELLQLLRKEGEEQFPRAVWARLYRISKMYLVQRGDLIGFFHRQLAEAVAARYPQRKRIHAKLAAYFEKAPIERKLDEYPYQLQQAEDWDNLAKALSDLDFFRYAWDYNRRYEWMGYWRLLKGRYDPGACYKASIEAKEKEEDEATYVRFLHLVGWFLDVMGMFSAARPFSERALAISESSSRVDSDTLAASLFSMAESYRTEGRYTEAIPLCQQALDIYQRILPDHINTAVCLHSLANIYYDQDKYDAALPLCQQAVAAFEYLLGSDKTLDPDITYLAGALGTLARIYLGQRRYDEALPLYQRALTITERAMGRDHPETADHLYDLAGFHRLLGHYSEAEALYQRALTINERALGPEHRKVCGCITSLGLLCQMQMRYGEALSYLERALDIAERTMGPDHIDNATIIIAMADLKKEQGQYAQALPLYQRALALREHVLEPKHPDVANTLDAMADLYYCERKYGEAVSLYQRALTIREHVLEPEHPDVANTLGSLARVYYEQGKYAQALSLLERAAAILEHPAGPERPSLAASLANLAVLYSQHRKHRKALRLCQRALAIYEQTVGSGHLSVASTLSTMADVYFQEHKYDKALPLWERALSIRERALDQQHPYIANLLTRMASAYYSKHDYARALDLYQKALIIQKSTLGNNNPETATTILDIAATYYCQGRYAEAIPLCQDALVIFEETLGPGHPTTAETLNSLGQSYYMQGKYAEALPYCQQAVSIADASLGSNHSNTKQYKLILRLCQVGMRKR